MTLLRSQCQRVMVCVRRFDGKMMVAVPAAAREPQSQCVVFSRTPLEFQPFAGGWIADGSQTFANRSAKTLAEFFSGIAEATASTHVAPFNMARVVGGSSSWSPACKRSNGWIAHKNCLSTVAVIVQLIVDLNFIFTQLNRSFETQTAKFPTGRKF